MADTAEIETARKLFAEMPREVFDLWLLPGIESYGWTFSSVNVSTASTEWEGFFGCHPMKFWAKAHWQLINIPAKKHVFHPETAIRIEWIIDNAYGLETPMAAVTDSAERFRVCTAFVREHGTIQNPTVATTTPEGLYLVDGHHRLAAVIHLGLADNFQLPVWIGRKLNSLS